MFIALRTNYLLSAWLNKFIQKSIDQWKQSSFRHWFFLCESIIFYLGSIARSNHISYWFLRNEFTLWITHRMNHLQICKQKKSNVASLYFKVQFCTLKNKLTLSIISSIDFQVWSKYVKSYYIDLIRLDMYYLNDKLVSTSWF